MPRAKTGAAIVKWKVKNGKRVKQWYACVSYVDESGKRRQWLEKAENKTAAKERAREMVGELDGDTPEVLNGKNMTFSQLAAFYKTTYLVEPEYVDGRKVAGLRTKYDYELRLKPLQQFFGKKQLRSITHGDLERYKSVRLKTPAITGKNTRGTDGKGKPQERQRSIATVHRELSLMRRILNVAMGNGWLLRNPFLMGKSIITPGDEKPRERILSRTEEEKLLAACTGWRAHLRPIIICALDTGMRRGELFKLTWADIDFKNRMITIQAFNTKTLRERQVAMTGRLSLELEELYQKSNKNPSDLVFGILTNANGAFDKVRREAEVPDLRFHDLRHTHATRLVSKHLPLSEVGRVLGHTQANTTYRYVNANIETVRRAAAALDEFNSAAAPKEESSS